MQLVVEALVISTITNLSKVVLQRSAALFSTESRWLEEWNRAFLPRAFFGKQLTFASYSSTPSNQSIFNSSP
jgi:hypothetical protein